MKFLFLALLFFLTQTQAMAGIVEITVAAKCDLKKSDQEHCLKAVPLIVTHDTLYVYTNIISSKYQHIPMWGSYCKNTLKPNQCMAQFSSDFDVFYSFIVSATENHDIEEKLLQCNAGRKLDSFTFTRNKHCYYK